MLHNNDQDVEVQKHGGTAMAMSGSDGWWLSEGYQMWHEKL